MEENILELRARPATSWELENVSAGFITALQVCGQVFGLTCSPHRPGEGPQSESVHLVGAFFAIITVLDRLAGTPDSQVPPDLVTASPKTFSPHQPTQVAPPQRGSDTARRLTRCYNKKRRGGWSTLAFSVYC